MDQPVVPTIKNYSANFKTKEISWGHESDPLPERFEIQFDSPDVIYFSEQVITGSVILKITEPLSLKGIKMRFKGECSLHFCETKTIIRRKKKKVKKEYEMDVRQSYLTRPPLFSVSRNDSSSLVGGIDNPGYVQEIEAVHWEAANVSSLRSPQKTGVVDDFVDKVLRPKPKMTVNRPKSTESSTWNDGFMNGPKQHFHAMETYFDCEFYIYGHKYQKSERESLPVGLHAFPFAFNLPPNLPTSFSSDRCIIRYFVAAVLDRPTAADIVRKAGFTVHSILDLNMDLHADSSCRSSKTINPCGLFCQTGPITASMLIPRSGYVPGETIVVSAELDNISGRSTKGSRLVLSQVITFIMPNKIKTHIEERIVKEIVRGVLAPGETDYWENVEITVPPVAPGNIQETCRLMSLHYKIELIVGLPLPWKELKVSIPITVGSVPLRQTFHSFYSPLDKPVKTPALPGTRYKDFPPYSFSECHFGKQNLEEQYELINGDEEDMGIAFVEKTPYAPTYIEYKPLNQYSSCSDSFSNGESEKS